jgi:hypothetical protein
VINQRFVLKQILLNVEGVLSHAFLIPIFLMKVFRFLQFFPVPDASRRLLQDRDFLTSIPQAADLEALNAIGG